MRQLRYEPDGPDILKDINLTFEAERASSSHRPNWLRQEYGKYTISPAFWFENQQEADRSTTSSCFHCSASRTLFRVRSFTTEST